MKRILTPVIGCAAVFLYTGSATALSAEQERRVAEEKRSALEATELETLKSQDIFVLTYGGWINYRYDNYSEDDNDPDTFDRRRGVRKARRV